MTATTHPMVIAIDGPAASGKGTLARRLAARLGFAHLDTGALYRAVALALLDAGGDAEDEAAATRVAAGLGHDRLADPRLRDEAVGKAASRVARYLGVRAALLSWQRDFAARPPGGIGAVLDGRDVGTIVCPAADLKIFLVAGARVRAQRRVAELLARGETPDFARILAEIEARDRQDRERAVAPLIAAADAYLLDSSDLDIEATLAAALDLVFKACPALRDRINSPQ